MFLQDNWKFSPEMCLYDLERSKTDLRKYLFIVLIYLKDKWLIKFT